MKYDKVVCYGYFKQQNAGDDQYIISINEFLRAYNGLGATEFYNPDTLSLLEGSCTGKILLIFGGGDVFNWYFLDPLYDLVQKMDLVDIIALSVGIPYTGILKHPLFKGDHIKQIYIRTKTDTALLQRSLHSHQTKIPFYVVPDISLLYCDKIINDVPKPKRKHQVVICLSRPIRCEECPNNYRSIVKTLGTFILYLIQEHKFDIILQPFNNNSNNQSENDCLINEDVINEVKVQVGLIIYNKRISKYIKVKKRNNSYEIINLFMESAYVIGMRYHSIQYAIWTQTPFFALYTTRKIENCLKNDMCTEYPIKYKPPLNEYDAPINMDINQLKCMMVTLMKHKGTVVNQYIKPYVSKSKVRMRLVQQIFKLKIMKDDTNQITEGHSLTRSFDTTIHANIIEALESKDEPRLISLLKPIDVPEEQELITELLLHKTLNNTLNGYDKYKYGLHEKLWSSQVFFDETTEDKLIDNLNWVQNDFSVGIDDILQSSHKTEMRLLNLDYIQQLPNENQHRFGWSYVIDGLKTYRSDKDDQDAWLCDVYLDRTFGWKSGIMKATGVIPYTKPWIGFLHHCFIEGYSQNNMYHLLKNPDFQASIPQCKGLFVLSDILKEQLEKALFIELGEDVIIPPVVSIKHPTGFVEKTFNYKSYRRNQVKKLIHVGAWMRDTYSFYDLKVPQNYQKIALIGKDVKGYFVPEVAAERFFYCEVLGQKCPVDRRIAVNNVVNKMLWKKNKTLTGGNEMGLLNVADDTLLCRDDVICRDNICRDIWSPDNIEQYREEINELTAYIESNTETVEFYEERDNDGYDDLFVSNVIFIKLFDASAVNTIVECIVRNTPLIVNRIPATEEYLGKEYPLFFTSMSDIPRLLEDRNVLAAHNYLKNMNKSFLTLTDFLKTFEDSMTRLLENY